MFNTPWILATLFLLLSFSFTSLLGGVWLVL